jgi:hypothetical protein
MLVRMASTALLDRLPHDRAPRLVGLRVRLRRAALDRALADGERPDGSALLARRARQLTRPDEVRIVAERLESILHDAGHPRPEFSARAPVERAQVAAARPFVTNLAERLREADDPGAAGVARARLLVTDGSSPIYAPADPGALARLAWRAADAL